MTGACTLPFPWLPPLLQLNSPCPLSYSQHSPMATAGSCTRPSLWLFPTSLCAQGCSLRSSISVLGPCNPLPHGQPPCLSIPTAASHIPLSPSPVPVMPCPLGLSPCSDGACVHHLLPHSTRDLQGSPAPNLPHRGSAAGSRRQPRACCCSCSSRRPARSEEVQGLRKGRGAEPSSRGTSAPHAPTQSGRMGQVSTANVHPARPDIPPWGRGLAPLTSRMLRSLLEDLRDMEAAMMALSC